MSPLDAHLLQEVPETTRESGNIKQSVIYLDVMMFVRDFSISLEISPFQVSVACKRRVGADRNALSQGRLEDLFYNT